MRVLAIEHPTVAQTVLDHDRVSKAVVSTITDAPYMVLLNLDHIPCGSSHNIYGCGAPNIYACVKVVGTSVIELSVRLRQVCPTVGMNGPHEEEDGLRRRSRSCALPGNAVCCNQAASSSGHVYGDYLARISQPEKSTALTAGKSKDMEKANTSYERARASHSVNGY